MHSFHIIRHNNSGSPILREWTLWLLAEKMHMNFYFNVLAVKENKAGMRESTMGGWHWRVIYLNLAKMGNAIWKMPGVTEAAGKCPAIKSKGK